MLMTALLAMTLVLVYVSFDAAGRDLANVIGVALTEATAEFVANPEEHAEHTPNLIEEIAADLVHEVETFLATL